MNCQGIASPLCPRHGLPPLFAERRLVVAVFGVGRGHFGPLPCALGYASTFRYTPVAVTSPLMSAVARDVRS